jgi:hypothetical protein
VSRVKNGLFGFGLVGGCLAWIVMMFVINALLVLLVWNGLDLHGVFGAGELTFTQALGVAIVLALVGI